MSRQVDERVVAMRFDNRQFEAGVKTSMSTLDKLKQKLSFKGTAKGIENVNSAAKKVNMSPLGNAADAVRTKFSAMEVMGVTALANITNSAVNAGKRIVSALTIDPVKTGFNEYELKMNSVQTIMASTGESLATVNQYLDELNKYSDDTIYSFSDMTQNIGKFTNAGVKLEDAVAAIKGISNEAALSGANANEAARSMYNFAQALSSGYVKLVDWKSIELANMATVDFKEQLIATAVEAGTLKKASDGMYKTLEGNTLNATKNFNETLQDQWMTSEVLIKTLKKYADTNTEIGKKATQAATEVKTFSQLMDTLKESAQSGWARTWEIMFGDFEEGKQLWTMMSKTVGGFIDKMNEARNNLLEGVFSSPWKKFDSLLSKTNVSADTFRETVKGIAKENGTDIDELTEKYGSFEAALSAGAIGAETVKAAYEKLVGAEEGAVASTEEAADKLKYFQEVVSKVWHGDYANGEARVKALTDAGYDYAAVQELVNKTVDGHKLTLEDLTDAQLKSVGVTDEQVKSIRELEEIAKESGVSLDELMEQMGKPSGRWLLIESLKNACSGLGKTFGAVKQAWLDIFRPDDMATRTKKIYGIIEAIHDFSTKLIPTDETVKKMTRTFRGLFAAVDIVATLVMGPLKIAFKLVTAILGEFGLNIWDITAYLGDGLVKLRDWIDGVLDFGKVAKALVDPIKSAMQAFNEWKDSLAESDNIPRDIILGLVKGIGKGIKTVVEIAMNLGKALIDTVKNILGIHSPSTVFFAIGTFIIMGLLAGMISGEGSIFKQASEIAKGILNNFDMDSVLGRVLSFGKNIIFTLSDGVESTFGSLMGVVKTITSKLGEYIEQANLGTIISSVFSFGTLSVVSKFADAIKTFAEPFEGLSDMFEEVGKGIKRMSKSFSNYMNAKTWNESAGALIKTAIAVAILAGAVTLLSYAKSDNLWSTVGAIAALGAVVAGLALTMTLLNKMDSGDKWFDSITKSFKNMSNSIMIISFAGAIAILAASLLILQKVDANRLWPLMGVLAALAGGMMAFVILTTWCGKYAKSAGSLMLKMGLSLLLLIGVIKLISTLSEEEIQKGQAFVKAFGLFIVALIGVSVLAGRFASRAGSMLLKITVALALLVLVTKMISKLTPEDIAKGHKFIEGFASFIGKWIATSIFAGKNAKKAGSMILKIALALLILVGVMDLLRRLSQSDIDRGMTVIESFGDLITKLIIVSLLGGRHAKGLGRMLIGVSAAMLILVGLAWIIGKMDEENLNKGLAVVQKLGILMAVLIASTSFAKGATGTVIALGVVIALLVAAVVGLSFMEKEDLAKSTIALTMLVGVFALLVKATSQINTKKGEFAKSLITLGVLVLVVGALGGLLVVMSKLKTENAIKNALALAILIKVIVSVADDVGKLGPIAKQIGKGALGISALLPVLAGLGLVLAMMSALKVDNAIVNVIVLTLFMKQLIKLSANVAGMAPYVKMVAKGALGISALIPVLAGIGLVLAMMSGMKVDNVLVNGAVLIIMLRQLVKIANNVAPLGGCWKSVAKGALGISALLPVLAGLALVLALMSAMDVSPTAIAAGLVVSLLLYALVKIADSVSKLGGKATDILKGAGVLAALAAVMLVLGLVLGIMAKMSPVEALANATIMSLVVLAMTGMCHLIGKLGTKAQSINKGITSIAALGVVMLGLSLVLTIMSDMYAADSAANAIILSGLLLVMVGIASYLGTLGANNKNINKGITSLGALSIVMLILTGVLGIMSTMSPGANLQNAIVLAVLLGALCGIALAAGKIGANVRNVLMGALGLTALSGVMLLLGGILFLLKGMDPVSAIATGLSLSLLMVTLAGVAAIVGVVGKNTKNILMGALGLTALTGVMTLLGGVMLLLKGMDPLTAIANCLALSLLMIALSGVGVIVGLIGKNAKNILMGSLGLAALVVVMAGLGLVLAMMTALNVQNAMANTLALTVLMTAMTILLVPLCGIGLIIGATGGFAMLGIVGLLAMAVPMVAFVGVLALMSLVPNAIDNAAALTNLMMVMTDMLVKLAIIGPLALIGVAAMQALMLVMAELGLFATAIGAIVSKVPVLEEFLDKGLNILARLAEGIGEILGSIIKGFLTTVSASLPEIGTNLSLFMTNAQPFIDGIKMIDDSVLNGVKNLAIAILALTAADLLNSIASIFTGKFSLVQLGLELSAFMIAIQPFIEGASMLNAEMMEGVNSLAKTILLLTATDVINGLTSWLTGGTSLSEFGKQLPELGTNLKEFAANLGAFGEDQVKSVTCAANAVQKIAQAAESIPVTEDGFWQKIVGGKSISTFGGYLPDLGTHLASFVKNLGTFTDAQVSKVSSAADAIVKIAEAAESIPVTEDGFWQKIVGGKSIETFGGYLPKLGTNLAEFVKNLGTFTDAQVQTAACACEALKGLAETAKLMPENENFWEKLFGGDVQTLEEFGGQLPKLGGYLNKFIKSVGTFGAQQVETVKAGVSAISAFAALGKVDLAKLTKNLPKFGDAMGSFAGKISTFITNMSEVDVAALTASIDSVVKLIAMFRDFDGVNADAVKTFTDSLKKMGETSVTKFIEEFNNSHDKVKTAAIDMMGKFIEGANGEKETLTMTFKTLAGSCGESMREKYQVFYDAGAYLVDGFAAGIGDNDFKAAAKASAMAKKAAQAAAAELEINSPSKVFRRIGSSVPEGFAQGIGKFGDAVGASAADMGDIAVDGVKSSIANISSTIGDELDAQPTIRPVLDLTDIRSGANALAALLGTDSSILANLNAASNSMNNYGQNGAVDDIISAIKELGSMERNSYTIGGITYEAGSDVAEAIEILCHAALIERRT